MNDQTPSRPAYRLPATDTLGAAVDRALTAARDTDEQLGRVMLVVTAAAVRDILTGHQPDAPFDAGSLELAEGEDGSLFPTGRYWTAACDERTFADAIGQTEAGNAVHDMSEWTRYLNDDTRDVWRPLCSEMPDRDRRPVYRLDLLRAAAVTLDEPSPAKAPREPRPMVEVMVCANERDRYPALVDPADQQDGYVRPWFDLPTVRLIAAETQAEAVRYGHGSVNTVHVLDGTVDGQAEAVVLEIGWMYLGGTKRQQSVDVIWPNEDGRYAVGGHFDWCWYALDKDGHPQIPFRPDPA
ncbi:hypothetical protein GCM10010250_21930 [Streptomyces althioticus]|uniref:hypothetical protein n=1 Tax=Streptomyces althioticus TaxID=83380 RepID=UPI001875494C|nr:hypothetical protein GCM10010250_21930 [Streptomyces althioticus]